MTSPASEAVTASRDGDAVRDGFAALEGGAVLYRGADGVAEVVLNRPAVLNAINGAIHHGILAALDRVVPEGELDAEVDRITSRIAGLKAEAVAGNKRLINRQYEAAGFSP